MFDPDAPDFKNIKSWLNSKPLSIGDFRGKVVLLDFWTYSCVNCVNTLLNLKILHQKYKDRGLVIIGVHTPEFEFEKDDENIQKALEKYGITYPVANDAENVTWKLYGNKYWPRRALVNGRGKIILDQVGEGGERKLEMKIIECLHEIGDKEEFEVEKEEVLTREDRMKVMQVLKKITPEIYTGWERSQNFGNSATCIPGVCTHFVDRGAHEQNIVYLQGDWMQEKEKIHKEKDEEGYVVLKYNARQVNAVLGNIFGKKYKVHVFLDGKPLERSFAGRDIKIDGTGSYVIVDGPGMYELVETETMQIHEVKLKSSSDEFTLYTFTFR